MQDFPCYVACRPTDNATQETFYTRYKRMHALKTSVICAVKHKWMCEVVTFAGRSSDLGVWTENPFAKSIAIESGVLGLADKGMNDEKEPRFVAPFKITQANCAMGLETSAN